MNEQAPVLQEQQGLSRRTQLVLSGVIPVLLALGVPWWQSWSSRKDLSAITLQSTQLDTQGASARVQVTIDGEPARQVFLTNIQLKNTGRVPVGNDDFSEGEPIKISFGGRCRVAEVRVINTKPIDVRHRVRVAFRAGDINVQPLLLNPQDKVDFSVVTSGCAPKVTTYASITGVASITTVAMMEERNAWRDIVEILIAMGVGALSVALTSRWIYAKPNLPSMVFGRLFIVMIPAILVSAVLLYFLRIIFK